MIREQRVSNENDADSESERTAEERRDNVGKQRKGPSTMRGMVTNAALLRPFARDESSSSARPGILSPYTMLRSLLPSRLSSFAIARSPKAGDSGALYDI